MVHILRAADRPQARSRTIRFEGAAYGTDISFFAVDNEPGQGPGLHISGLPAQFLCPDRLLGRRGFFAKPFMDGRAAPTVPPGAFR